MIDLPGVPVQFEGCTLVPGMPQPTDRDCYEMLIDKLVLHAGPAAGLAMIARVIGGATADDILKLGFLGDRLPASAVAIFRHAVSYMHRVLKEEMRNAHQ